MERHRTGFRGLPLLTGSVILLAFGIAQGYETYHDPSTEGAGYCAACHDTFPNRGDAHDLHVGNGQFTSECNLCHTGSGRNNPYTMWSVDPTNPYGCAGCHGRDYGETTSQSYNNGTGSLNPAGAAKMSGYGLRKQHKNKGVTVCESCHTDVPQSSIQGEDVDPPYYARSDVDITDACNTDGTEDNTPEPNGEDTLGLDNDGDGFIDGLDPDCGAAAATPGETSGPALARLIVTAHDTANGILSLSYGNPCSATQNNIAFGDIAAVGSYAYEPAGAEECSIGTTGTYDWSYTVNPNTPASFFFLIVGNDGAAEGSYGLDSAGAERPEDTIGATCPVPQDLTNRCD